MPSSNTLSNRVWDVRIKGMSGLEYRWGGATTVNIYQDGAEVDVFMMGTADTYATFDEFHGSVVRREACLAGEHTDGGDGYCEACGEPVARESLGFSS